MIAIASIQKFTVNGFGLRRLYDRWVEPAVCVDHPQVLGLSPLFEATASGSPGRVDAFIGVGYVCWLGLPWALTTHM